MGGKQAHGFTLPLVTSSSGSKFGKTVAGAVWLDAQRTSPYRFFQFWINTDDADTARYLRYFTLLSREEILALQDAMAEKPEAREAQARLAHEVTTAVHGPEAAETAAALSRLLFGGGDAVSLRQRDLAALRAEIPFHQVNGSEALAAGVPAAGAPPDAIADTMQLLVDGKLAASRGAARRLLEQGGVYIYGRRLTAEQKFVRSADFLPGRYILMRKGARDYLLVNFAP
jgi:tyrosyl-tRNA synthetase